MVLVTDGECDMSADIEDLQTVVGAMKSNETVLYVINIGLVHDVSSVKGQNAIVLREIAENTGGAYCNADDIAQCLMTLSGKPGCGTRPQLSKNVLEITPLLRIPVNIWGMTSKDSPPSMSKFRVAAPDEDEDGGGGGGDGAVEPTPVERETLTVNPDQPDEVIAPADQIAAHKYGQNFIPWTEGDKDAVKLKGPSGVFVLGFLPATSVPRHHLLTSTSVMQGIQDHEAAAVGITALSRALRRTNQVALVRFVKKEHSDPQLMVLSPASADNGTLLMHQVPCKDDVRNYSFPPLKETTREQQSAVSSFVDSMTISSVAPHRLAPMNSAIYGVTAKIVEKLAAPVTLSTSLRIAQMADQFEAIPYRSDAPEVASAKSATIASSLETLKSHFPLKTNESTLEKRKIFFSDLVLAPATQEILGGGGGGGASQKRARVESQEETGPVVPIFSEQSTAPLEDFQALLSFAEATQADKISAMHTMEKHVTRTVTQGRSKAQYKKALEFLSSLRAAAITTNEAQLYNAFLVDHIKPFAGSIDTECWDMFVAAGNLSLITNEELPETSSITPQEAIAFLQVQTATTTGVGGGGGGGGGAMEVQDSMFDDLE